ncbi:MAG: hypothetical protein FJX57_14970 [Alphaproteobacteria bacterium]|nr:hypothetical protein [Alphaproteobacteria bacterium]
MARSEDAAPAEALPAEALPAEALPAEALPAEALQRRWRWRCCDGPAWIRRCRWSPSARGRSRRWGSRDP